MLTDGNNTKSLYQHWDLTTSWDYREVKYFLGDECCVPPEDIESIFGLLISTLFPNSNPKDCKVTRMEGEFSNRETVERNYEQMLPKSLDILLLSCRS